MAQIEENIWQIKRLSDACYVTLRCSMCGTKLRDPVLNFEQVAEMAWEKGWRMEQNTAKDDVVLCPLCTDNKR